MSGDNDSMNRRRFVQLAGSAAATATLAGCTSDGSGTTTTEGGGGGTTDGGGGGTTTKKSTPTPTPTPQAEFKVTITQGQMPTTLDPQNHRSTPTDNVVLHAYEGMLARDRTGKMMKELATNFERKEKGRIRFKVREGVTFHNGGELTPEDVAFSINRIVKKSVSIKSPQRDQLAGVTGAKVVDGERAVDVMSDGLNPIVFSLFATYCDIMKKSWVKDNEKSYVQKNMNGTGPFKLKTYESGVKVVLERFEDYWQEPAEVTQLTFRAAKESSTRVNQLLEGETDVIVNVPPQSISKVNNSNKASISAVPSTRIIFNAMRYDVEPFSNRKFRQAMNYAVNLTGIIKNVLQTFGDATSQPTLEGFVGYNKSLDPYPHDPATAEQLVSESGFDGAEITLHTPVGRYLKDVEIAQAVASQIDGLSNVSCEVKQREFATLAGELVDGKIETSPHFYLIGWGNATFDASQTILPLLTTDGSLTSYSNKKVDKTMTKAQSTGDADKRESLLKQANKMLHNQSPWIYLNRQYSVYGVSTRVKWKARRDERIDAYAMSPAQ